jgi:hypothetical protein
MVNRNLRTSCSRKHWRRLPSGRLANALHPGYQYQSKPAHESVDQRPDGLLSRPFSKTIPQGAAIVTLPRVLKCRTSPVNTSTTPRRAEQAGA